MQVTEMMIREDAEKHGISLPYSLVKLCIEGEFLPSESIVNAFKRQEKELEESEAEEKRTKAKAKAKEKMRKRLAKQFPILDEMV